MRNIPDFTCEYGVATLILRELHQTGRAYCIARWVRPGLEEGLAEECGRFCRMAQARESFISGLELDGEPAFRILRMTGPRPPAGDAHLWPLLPENWESYRNIYNQAMAPVHGARMLGDADRDRLLSQGGCHFVHRDSRLLGLGQVEDNCLSAIVSHIPGQGAAVAGALLSISQAEVTALQVADTNRRAMALYERLGFTVTGVAETWWRL